MASITLDEIQHDFLGSLRRAMRLGEPLIVLDADRPVAEIRPVARPEKTPRPFGLCAGEFTVPDDFDTPLPEDVLRQFEGT